MATKKINKDADVVQRSFWVNRELWNETKAQAARSDKSISDVVRALLEKWVSGEVQITDKPK